MIDIKNTINHHKQLLIFTLLNYIDKFIAFSLPLVVLYISKNQQIYNDIEYIFSIASIAVVFFDLGINTYYFYGFKESDSRIEYIEKVREYFSVLLMFYEIIGLLILPIFFFYKPTSFIFIFVYIRLLYLLYVSFSASYYRLKDKPSFVYWLSIPVNLLSLVALYLFRNISNSVLFGFFAPQFILLFVGSYFYIKNKVKIDFKKLITFLTETLKYSWPILINISMIAYINNFGKIYAYNYLSSNDMYQISYVLRISLIVQMAHSSIIAFYSKAIYEDKNYEINKEIFKKYSLLIFLAVVLFFCFILGLNLTKIVKPISINLASFLIVLYTIVWCYRSYFEMYFGKYNKNKIVLLFSIISTTVYTGYIVFFGIGNFLQLSILMLLTALISFISLFLYLRFIILKKT
ncbi:MAG: hypothetical protein GZ091_14100 [Paludibacter sp.]|nr:hypothetical protein [Paludibacter sp.]